MMPTTTSTLDVVQAPAPNAAGAEPLSPPLREYWELRRRQLIAELKMIEKILGVAVRQN